MTYFVLISAFVMSWVLTLCLRRYALAKSVLDIPNERSSHSIPTPRGGGVAIVLTVSAGIAALSCAGLIPVDSSIAYLGAGLGVAALGFADDHGHIAARWRLAGHALSASWALYWLKGLAPLSFAGMELSFGVVGTVVGVIYLVWMLNLYNFMDGIDGLASVEAITVCAGACLMYALTGHLTLSVVPLLVALATLGFLLWNFPIARIFMGDAGSGFLGVLLGALALEAAWIDQQLFWAWIVLLGVFIVDATWTLGHRLLRKQRVYEAHRSHAYQIASRYYGSHKKVTVAVAAINCVWLWPVAFCIGLGYVGPPVGVLLGFIPLACVAWHFRAGSAE